jgi:hypothetical protein
LPLLHGSDKKCNATSSFILVAWLISVAVALSRFFVHQAYDFITGVICSARDWGYVVDYLHLSLGASHENLVSRLTGVVLLLSRLVVDQVCVICVFLCLIVRVQTICFQQCYEQATIFTNHGLFTIFSQQTSEEANIFRPTNLSMHPR